jgi:hypothetical protein
LRRFLGVALLLAVVPVGAEKTVPSLRDVTRASMVEGLDALDQRDYPKAQGGFLAAQALLDQRPLPADTYEDRSVRAAVAYLTAKATGEARLGDPCPILKMARSYVDTAAVLAASQPKIDHMREIGTEADEDIAAANTKFGCVKASPAPKGTTPAKLAGHYYLSGVREVGSELLLRPDGSYDWFLSYGAVDQFSTGTWARVGDAVVLRHAKAAVDAPLFKLGNLEPWDAPAESYLQDAAYEARVAAIYKQCPFLDEPVLTGSEVGPPMVTTMTPSPPSPLDPPKPDPLVVYQKAKAREVSARRTYERAADSAMKIGANDPSTMIDARLARYEWQTANYDMLSARNGADLSEALPPQPRLPGRCVVPDKPSIDSIPEKAWIRGFAVIVGDPAVDMKFRNVDVSFRFADGTSTDRKTERGGIAWVEKHARNPVTAITLNYRGAGRDNARPERFTVATVEEGVQQVIIESRQITAPPFDEMHLSIRGGELVGPDDRGRYSKHD